MKILYSNILVIIQFGAIAAIAFTGPLFAKPWYLLVIEAAGIFLGVYAILVMRVGNFNVRPIVKTEGRMVTHGPYRIIRHPMYTSILLTLIPLLIHHFTWIRLTIMLILTINLIIKMVFEESLLKAHFPSYRSYMKKTYRIIPFIF